MHVKNLWMGNKEERSDCPISLRERHGEQHSFTHSVGDGSRAPQRSWTGWWVPMHVAQYSAPQCLLFWTLCLPQQVLEEATHVMEGAVFSRARMQWKQRFMSFADGKTAHFLKNMDILLDLHATGSKFLAKFLLNFDHWRILVASASNSTVFLN